MRIERVDPDDAAAIEAFHSIYHACGRNDAPNSFVGSPLAELADVIRTPTEDFAYAGFLAYDGDAPVGQGWYAAFRRANLDQVFVTPRVLPGHRGSGVGTEVLRRLEEQARADGRTLLMSSPRWTIAHGPDGADAPAVAFARRHGYGLKLVEARRRLSLPVAASLLDELTGRADPSYTITAFAGPVPDELVEGWAALEASLPTEAPTGELEMEEEPASVASIRGQERILAESGQVKYNAVALSAEGEVVGYTEIVVRGAGAPAEQLGTLVRRTHRGHGLGHGLKAALLRLLQDERPDISATVTSNALSNAAMVAVNDRLGYRVVEYLGNVQRRVGVEV